MPSVMQLDRCCWNYHIALNDYEALPPMAKELSSIHIHLAAVEYFDVIAVAMIQGNFSGMWDLLNTHARIKESSAAKLISDTKRSTRARFREDTKSGLLVPVHNCSPRRVENTFEHIMFNQGIKLFDAERDGFPQF